MMKKILTPAAVVALFGLLVIPSGCVDEDFDSVPPLENVATWKPNATIAEVKALFYSTNNPDSAAGLFKDLATNDFWNSILEPDATDSSVVIEGYVISCDSAANFYETVTIMDETGGIDLKINASDLYLTYGLKPGQKVLVKVNDMALDNYRGTYQVGLAYTDFYEIDNNWESGIKVTGIDIGNLPTYVQLSGGRVTLEPIDLTIDQVNDNYLQKLVRINNVQFWDPTKTYSIDGVNTNRYLVDCNENLLVLRNSGYASFNGEPLPSGNGSVVGVLSKYDETYQLYIRDLNDVRLTGDRCGASAPTPNTTISALKAMCTSNLVQINQDIVIQCVVDGNDESGNLYKQLFLFDETAGLEFKVDVAGLYTDFPVGTKVVINCNGLYLGKYGGVVQLGGVYNNAIGRLSADEFYKKVYIVESGLTVSSTQTTISEINDGMIGKLITLTDVQFVDSEMGKTYAESSATTNRNLEDFGGNKVIVRTSNYADFAGITLPNYKGTVTAILSKYSSDYQLYIRSLSDVRMVQPRWVKNYLLAETFSNATLSQPITVNGWSTVAEAGSKKWVAKEYPSGSGAKYAEMNPYQSGESSNIAWLISPKVAIPAGGNVYLSFLTEYAYWANSTLKVYISSDYNGTDPTQATWTELTDARIVAQSDGQNRWVDSGLVDLSQFSGDVYIGFRYVGSTSLTTAYRVDDVNLYTQQ